MQYGFQLVNHGISHGLCSPAKLDHRHQFGRRVADCPDPHILLAISDTGPKFIQLNVFRLETDHKAIVEFLSMFAAACQPGADGTLADLAEILDGGDVYPENCQVECLPNLLRWRFQTIHYGVFAAGEAVGAGVALQILDPFRFPAFSIPHHSMDILISDSKIVAAFVGAKITLGCDRFLSSTFSLELAPWHWWLMMNSLLWMICLAAGAIFLRFWFIDEWFWAWFLIRFLTQHFELLFSCVEVKQYGEQMATVSKIMRILFMGI